MRMHRAHNWNRSVAQESGSRFEREPNFPEASTQSRLIELEEDLKKGLAPLKRQGWLGTILLSQGQVVVVPLSS